MVEEIFDIVDENDCIVGRASRKEVHGNPNLIHRVAHVLVFNSKNELYLQKRSLNKDVQPGKWDTSVGGHVNLGETYQNAAFREIKEELGFEPDSIHFLYKYLHSNDVESEFVSTYQCVWDGPIEINPEEITEGRFWNLNDMVTNLNKKIFTPNFIDEITKFNQIVLLDQSIRN